MSMKQSMRASYRPTTWCLLCTRRWRFHYQIIILYKRSRLDQAKDKKTTRRKKKRDETKRNLTSLIQIHHALSTNEMGDSCSVAGQISHFRQSQFNYACHELQERAARGPARNYRRRHTGVNLNSTRSILARSSSHL